MSTTIDERVLEMRFDNRQFETNVSSTMSTLDKLKEKLNFKGASKGLENVNAAAKNVNITGLGSAVETVSAKFSALQVVGVTALANITNSAVNAGKRIVSALTIDPIKTGLSEYETKINSIQVIRANTRGKNTMDEITAALDSLNDYADRTIYNFAQMTDNVGKFVAQGLDVHQAAKAVEGLANLAGASGASASDMARATYQMSQALGGTIRKIDWNSLRNANMATVELKNTLMDLARVRGIDIDKMIKDKGTFEDTLEKGWLTGELFTEAMNIYSDVYSEAELRAKGFTDSQIKNFKDLARMAKEATTEVKTFTQLCDVLKETAQSGWTQTWELIFGDFDASKAIFTDLQVYFSDIINGWSEARNNLLKNVLHPSDVLDSIFGKLGHLGDLPGFDKITEISDKIIDFTDKLEYYQDVVNKVWRGEYENGQPRIDLLTKAGYNSDVVQELVNKGAQYKLTVEDIQAAHEKFGVTLDENAKVSEKTSATFDGISEALDNLSDEQLKNAGLTEDEIRLCRELQKESKRTGRSIENLAKAMSEKGGRELVIDTIKNAWAGLVNILKAVKDAWYDVFSPISAVRLYTIIESVEAFSRRLRDNGEVAENVGSIFRGLFAAIDIFITVLSGPFKVLTKIVAGVLKALGTSFLEVTAKLGDGIVAVRDAIDGVIGSVSKFIAEHISKWIEKFKEIEVFTTVAEWFSEAGETISDSVGKISKKIDEFDASGFMDGVRTFGDFLSDLAMSLENSEIFTQVIDSVCGAFKYLRDFFGRFKLPEFNLDNTTFYTALLEKFDGVKNIGGLVTTFGSWLKDRMKLNAKNTFKEIFSVDWATFKADSLEKFTAFWLAAGDKIKAGLEKCKEILKTIGEFIFGTEDINLPAILDVAEKFLGIMVLIKTLKLLNTLVSPFDNVTDALNNLASKLKWQAIGTAFKSMAIAFAAITLCIIILASMPDIGKAWEAMKMLGIMLLAMGGVIAGLMFMASKMPSEDTFDIVGVSLSILALVGAVYLLTQVLEAIDSMTLKDPEETFFSLGLMLVALAAGIKIIAAAGSSSFKSVAAILTLVSALKLILTVIDAYDQYDWAGKADAIWRMAGMLAILSAAINIASRGVKSNAGASGLAMLLLAMVFSLKILLSVMENFAAMDIGTLLKGGAVIAALFFIMSKMMIAVGNANKGAILEKGQKSVNNFVGLATALLAVVAAIWLLGKMATKDTDTFISGGLAVATILGIFTGMITAIGKSCSGLKMGTVIVALIGMGLLIAEVAILLNKMKDVPWQQSLGTAGALAAVLFAMATALRILNKSKIDATNVVQWIGALAGLTLIVWALSNLLAGMENVSASNAIGNAVALSTLLMAMSLSLKILSSNKVNTGSVTPWIGAIAGLGLIVLGMAGILLLLDGIDSSKALENAGALALLAVALSLCTIPLAVASSLAPAATVGAQLLIALATILGLLVAALSFITGVDTARENAITLSNLAIVLSLCTIPLAVAGLIAPAATVGAGLLVALATILGLLVAALSFITGVDAARTNTETIIMLVSALTDMVLLIGGLGINAIAAVIALKGIIPLVTSIGTLAVAIGALSSHWDGLDDFLNNGLEILKKLGRGLGEVISEFGVGLSSGLPEIATNLSEFAFNLLPFVMTMNMIKDDVVTRAENLAAAIAALATANVLDSFSPGELSELGTDLSNFALNMAAFSVVMSSFKPETVTAVETLCSAVKALTGANLKDAITQIFPGDNSLGSFGEQIAGLADGIKSAAASLSELTQEDVDHITLAADAAKAMAVLNDAIPRSGGNWQDWAGEKNLATWGETLAAFGDSIVAYNEKISGEDFDTDSITASADAAKALADVSTSIPRSGGNWQEWTGEKNLATWGETLVAFGQCLVDYNSKVTGNDFNTDAIANSATAAAKLTEVVDALPRSDGAWQELIGEKNLGTFGTQLAGFADGLVAYCTAASGIDQAALDSIEFSKQAVTKLQEVVALLDPSGGWWNSIAGSADGKSFGDGLCSLAQGIILYCTAASRINENSLTNIENSKQAIIKLKEVTDELPEVSISARSSALRLVIDDFKIIGDRINELTTADHDYTGIDNLKTAINRVAEIVGEDGANVTDVGTKYLGLKDAMNIVVACSDDIMRLNERSYAGIGTFKAAVESLKTISLEGITEAFSGSDEVVSAMESVVVGMAGAIEENIDYVTRAMSKLATSVYNSLIERTSEFRDAGETLVTEFSSGVIGNRSASKAAGSLMAGEAVSGASSKVGSMEGAGNDLGSGLVDGIREKWDDAWSAGYTLGAMAVAGEKAGQASNSPSKLTIQAGKWLGEGLVIGMERMGRSVYNAGAELGRTATKTVSGTISKIATAINTDIDSQPTIRPVLDLSDVRSGAATISSLFDTTSQVGVMANVGTVSTMMRGYGQNGGNDDVVSAIDKLRRDLGNVRGDSYMINGVTYDDGSNIADAVRTIARAAIMERRM